MDHRLEFSLGDALRMHFYASLKGEPMPPYAYPHHIENEIELFLLVEGDISFNVESRVYKLKRGDIILTKPNEMHHCIRNSNTVNNHYCFYFDPSCASIFADFMQHNFGCDNLISPAAEDRELILSLAERIDRSFAEGSDGLERFTLVLEMLLAVKRNLGVPHESEMLPPMLEKILEAIDERLGEADCFDEICEEFFISRSTLGRLFKRHLATSPGLYLEGKRLAVARRMLEGGETVGDTCKAVGFSSVSSFIRLFKERFGETPLKYSKREARKG